MTLLNLGALYCRELEQLCYKLEKRKMEYQHTPVMLREVLEYLRPKPGENFIDCTLGGGGYTYAIARRAAPRGKVLAIDLDELAIRHTQKIIDKNKNLSAQARFDRAIARRAGKNIIIVHDNFKNLSNIAKEYCKDKEEAEFSGIVFDLGLSQAQLKDRTRGFSFQLDTPLKMSFRRQMADSNKLTTEKIISNYREENLERIIKEYGEERYAKLIAREIVKRREKKEIKTTGQLVDIIERAVPGVYKRQKIHFATRTFQALRIATNNELLNLEQALPQALDLLKPGGRIVVVSYHSLEDRIVKHFFRKESKDCICPKELPLCQCDHVAKLKIITKKVIIPSPEEIAGNPRARSAKMRVAKKI